MTATPPAAPLNAAKREIPADVLPLMETAREFVRAQKMNRVEKLEESSALLERIRGLPSAFDVGISASEQEARKRRRAELWAQRYAFEELEREDHLTPERREELHARARKELPRWARYAFADELVRGIEEEATEPSRTAKLVKERAQEAQDEVSNALSFALTDEQILLLSSLNARRRRRRFRTIFSRGYEERILLDVPVRAPYAPFRFDSVVESCATLSEVKTLLAIWVTEFVVERRNGAAVVVGDGFEIHPSE